jgi:hypothetical protein
MNGRVTSIVTFNGFSKRLKQCTFVFLCALATSFLAYLVSFAIFYYLGLRLEKTSRNSCVAYTTFSYFASMYARAPIAIPFVSLIAAVSSVALSCTPPTSQWRKPIWLAGAAVFFGGALVFFNADPYVTTQCKHRQTMMGVVQAAAEIVLIYCPTVIIGARARPTKSGFLLLIVALMAALIALQTVT